MDGQGFSAQNVGDTALGVAGRGIGAIAALADLWANRDPMGLLKARSALMQDPGFREQAGPFMSGLLWAGGSRQPVGLGVGGTGPSAPERAFVPNFGPLPPQTAAKQNEMKLIAEALANVPPDQQEQVGRGLAGIPTIGAIPPGMTPTSYTDPLSHVRYTQQPSAPQAVPLPGAPGMMFAPVGPSGRIFKQPTAGGEQAGGITAAQARLADPKVLSLIAAGKMHVPGMTAEDAKAALQQESTDKASAALERAQVLQELKDASVATATKQMIDSAPEVKGIVATIRKDLQDLGPDVLSARYQDIMTQKIGFPNRAWAKYAYDLELLPTKLSQMHGQRGKYIVAEFKRGLESGKQSADNMFGALDSIDGYADQLLARREASGRITPGGMPPKGPPAMPGPAAQTPPAGAEEYQTTPGGNQYRVLP
jgi:hypothetical protein